jgi:glycerophosphoryl diester phosphodiesterase
MNYFTIMILGSILTFSACHSNYPDIKRATGDNIRIRPQFSLFAHRGGVTMNGKNPENSIAALDEAIRRGYTGAEIDVRQSSDGVLFLYHNRTFERDYDSRGTGSEMTWKEIRSLRPLREGVSPPVSMEEYCTHAMGKLKELMVDIKIDQPPVEFYREVERILQETGFLNSSFFIGHGAYFIGKGPMITMLTGEKNEFFEKYGDKTRDYYFLFAGVDEINARTIRWAQDNKIRIVCHANLPYRTPRDPEDMTRAGRNIRWLMEWGITSFQIDSDYDIFFR